MVGLSRHPRWGSEDTPVPWGASSPSQSSQPGKESFQLDRQRESVTEDGGRAKGASWGGREEGSTGPGAETGQFTGITSLGTPGLRWFRGEQGGRLLKVRGKAESRGSGAPF